ncbi:MAG TPA: 4'-phosphopantetheinyl transferase superfamily protein [Casimicrobiaceae bacterium]|nr:4'-phosphopantetheinyl transferase superfamily protein [Casimicrobiaceae bacterium]
MPAAPAGPIALAAPDAGIALWLCPLDPHGDDDADALAGLLSPAELARADRFGALSLRKRWIAGRATLRRLLGDALGIAPAAVAIGRGVRGRPQLAAEHGLDFNVSHTGDVALIGIASGLPIGSRIGVDIERHDRTVDADRLARKFMADAERAAMNTLDADARRRHFLSLWTCKEAMSKATGDAMSAPFRKIAVALDGGPRLIAGPPPYLPQHWRLVVAAVPADFIATVVIWRGL